MFKSHPYEYITPSNFETIRESLRIGLTSGKTPAKIAEFMEAATHLPMSVCMAIVQQELLGTLENLKEDDD